ncbi:MAG: cytochrome C peroxidase, partial [Bacteroidia bacterium]|nr:cytochrome C peroxidase [Bacteroidia bacterium]
LFAGKGLCGSCHFFPLFNGSVPPFYIDSEFEVIGTAENSTNKKVDKDEGRYLVTGIPEQRFAFKTPTVRNIEFTAPYMHNGSYKELKDVVEFYHKGGGNGFGFNIPNQTLPFDSLQLNASEKENIIHFMKSLSDTTGTIKKPVRLPAFENDGLLNKRKIGGEY